MAISEDMFLGHNCVESTTGGKGIIGIQWVETRDAAYHPQLEESSIFSPLLPTQKK